MHNRKFNATNPNQGNAKRVLCVCSAGLLRSPTLAHVLSTSGLNTRAAGSTATFALIVADEVLIHWADEIVFVNKENYNELKQTHHASLSGKFIKILDIPDEYEYRHPQLELICHNQYWNTHSFTYSADETTNP